MSGVTNRQHLAALTEQRKIIRRQQTALYEAQGALARVRAECDRLSDMRAKNDQIRFGADVVIEKVRAAITPPTTEEQG